MEYMSEQGTDNYEDTPEFMELATQINLILEEILALHKKKNASYSPENIAITGERGIFLRVMDKVIRLYQLVWLKNRNPLADESITDTWMDLALYAIIAVAVRRGVWPKSRFNLRD